MLKANGGSVVAQLGTHFIYPGSGGYALAGGAAGPQVDYNMFPAGNIALATKYMKAAGYPSGRYSGGATLTVVGATGDPFPKIAAITNHALQSLGFKTNFTLVDQSVMYGKYCGVPAREIDVCPNIGWIRDFSDPQTILAPTFAGYNIASTNNANISQTDDPKINAAMKPLRTSLVTAPERTRGARLIGCSSRGPWRCRGRSPRTRRSRRVTFAASMTWGTTAPGTTPTRHSDDEDQSDASAVLASRTASTATSWARERTPCSR